MHTRTATAAAVLLTAALALTGCSSSDKPNPAPTTAPAATTTAAPTRADLIKRCSDAIQARKDNGATAPECKSLPTDDYFEAIQAANKAGRDALEKQIEEATGGSSS